MFEQLKFEETKTAPLTYSSASQVHSHACLVSTPVLQVKNLSCGYTGKPVLSNVSLSLEAGEICVLLGPNGVGKTTLFKTILGFLPRIAGSVFVQGEEVQKWSRQQFAQMVAYVPQLSYETFGFSVREMVLMGRTPTMQGISSPSRNDEKIVSEVIEDMGLNALADQDYTTLSGGQKQMVLIARALAQRPCLLVMDEPCANLDVGNQVRVLLRIQNLAQSGLAILVTSHAPDHALLLNDKVVCINRTGVIKQGLVSKLLDVRMLEDLYGVEMGIGKVVGKNGQTALACAPFLKEYSARECGV